MAHILMLTPQVPYPPRQGTALRNWGILRGLAAHHRVSLLTFAAPDQAMTPPSPLADIVERVAIVPQPIRTTRDRLRDLLTRTRPDLALRLESAAFRQQMRAWLDTYAFDWIFVEGLEMAPYLDLLSPLDSISRLPFTPSSPSPSTSSRLPSTSSRLPSTSSRLPSTSSRLPSVVFDAHNCEYLLQKRAGAADLRRPRRWPAAFYSAIQWRRLRRFEAAVCRRADLVIAVSEADAQALQGIVPQLEPIIIPNGITLAEYASFTEKADLQQPAFVFTGTMDFRPNVDGILWFAKEVWPDILSLVPFAHCYVVGRNPHPRLDALHQIPGMMVTGAVPDTRPYIKAAAVYIIPLLVGGGTRLKLLEAAAMGKAIVSTSPGAEGFPNPETAVHLADYSVVFADACLYFIENPAARADYEARARAYARAYDWEVLLPPLLERLETATRKSV